MSSCSLNSCSVEDSTGMDRSSAPSIPLIQKKKEEKKEKKRGKMYKMMQFALCTSSTKKLILHLPFANCTLKHIFFFIFANTFSPLEMDMSQLYISVTLEPIIHFFHSVL